MLLIGDHKCSGSIINYFETTSTATLQGLYENVGKKPYSRYTSIVQFLISIYLQNLPLNSYFLGWYVFSYWLQKN